VAFAVILDKQLGADDALLIHDKRARVRTVQVSAPPAMVPLASIAEVCDTSMKLPARTAREWQRVSCHGVFEERCM